MTAGFGNMTYIILPFGSKTFSLNSIFKLFVSSKSFRLCCSFI